MLKNGLRAHLKFCHHDKSMKSSPKCAIDAWNGTWGWKMAVFCESTSFKERFITLSQDWAFWREKSFRRDDESMLLSHNIDKRERNSSLYHLYHFCFTFSFFNFLSVNYRTEYFIVAALWPTEIIHFTKMLQWNRILQPFVLKRLNKYEC